MRLEGAFWPFLLTDPVKRAALRRISLPQLAQIEIPSHTSSMKRAVPHFVRSPRVVLDSLHFGPLPAELAVWCVA